MHNFLDLQVHPFLMKTATTENNVKTNTKHYKTTEAIFEKQLHAYTITHAIDDRNVLKFHIDYFKGKGT